MVKVEAENPVRRLLLYSKEGMVVAWMEVVEMIRRGQTLGIFFFLIEV